MFRNLLVPARRVAVRGSYDVIVAGGGPAGVGAAVSAARHGARVLLLEQTGCLGGMGTSALVTCFAPLSWQNPPDRHPITTGLVLEVLARMKRIGGTDMDSWPSLDAEKLKLVYDEIASEAGVTVRFFSPVIDVLLRRNRVEAVLVAGKGGIESFRGTTFIDATGDADLAARAGVPFAKGSGKGELQGCTLCFTVAGVDTRAYWKFARGHFKSNRQMNDWLRENVARGTLQGFPKSEHCVIAHKVIYPGIVAYNYGHVFGLDGTRPEDLTRGVQTGRKLAHAFLAFARKRVPGMAQAHLVSSGALLGVRETRRIHGRQVLTVDDFRRGRQWVDNIALCDYPVDIHGCKIERSGSDKTGALMNVLRQPPGGSYGIPFGVLQPARPGNLLVAGRSISCDRWVQGSLRVMPVCLATGQAAGAAAAQAVRARCAISEIDLRRLQQTLTRDGLTVMPRQEAAVGTASRSARTGRPARTSRKSA